MSSEFFIQLVTKLKNVERNNDDFQVKRMSYCPKYLVPGPHSDSNTVRECQFLRDYDMID